ncbi:hypothetical protein MKX03_024772 [Papaver bracteatum]|nr:hypothetical protein MKX03_024772 [Papaver bracteatum]
MKTISVTEYLNYEAVSSTKYVSLGSVICLCVTDMGSSQKCAASYQTIVFHGIVCFLFPVALLILKTDKAERLIAGASAYGAELVVFPEAFIGGYPRIPNFGVTRGRNSIEENDEFQKYHAAAIDIPEKYEVHLVMGVVEREGSILYSSVIYFDCQGQYLGGQRKVMLTALEHEVWHSGDKATLPAYKTSIGNIGGLICWDNIMPLLRSKLYSKGVKIYCAPTADARDTWRASMTHTAIKGGCFVLSVNQYCQRKDYSLQQQRVSGDTNPEVSPDSVVCSGGSIIISPSGAILAGLNYHEESLISADLELTQRKNNGNFDKVPRFFKPIKLMLPFFFKLSKMPSPFTFTTWARLMELMGVYLVKNWDKLLKTHPLSKRVRNTPSSLSSPLLSLFLRLREEEKKAIRLNRLVKSIDVIDVFGLIDQSIED